MLQGLDIQVQATRTYDQTCAYQLKTLDLESWKQIHFISSMVPMLSWRFCIELFGRGIVVNTEMKKGKDNSNPYPGNSSRKTTVSR